MRTIPDISNGKQGISKRQQAHTLFLAGKNLNEVCAALNLKRSTASSYLYEARCIAKDEPHRVVKQDSLLD